ncbi:MAG: YdbH domain-containing protein, partial [Proteobacteria bacterium]|nr:YdbH domain-containing protein [Pseudomonadota bacterium]
PGYTIIGEGSLLVAGPGEAALRIDSRVTTRWDERFRPGSIEIEEYFVRLAGADFWPGIGLTGTTIQLAGEAARSEDGDVTGTAALEAHAAGISGGRATSGPASIQAALDFAWDGSSARIRLRERGEIVAESAKYGDALAIPGRFRARLNKLDMTLTRADGDGAPRFAFAAEIEPADFVAELIEDSGETTRVEVAAGPLSVEAAISPAGRISSAIGLSDARVAALGHGATFSGLSARVTIDPEGSSATTIFEIASLEDASEPPKVAPLRLDGTFNIVSGRVEGSARVFHRGDLQIASLALSSGDDVTRLSVEAEDISFSPSGLQPRDIFPSFDFLSAVEGSVRGGGSVTISNGELLSQGTLELESLSFSSSKGSVRSLQGQIVFDSLWPPSTPAGQRLTAEGATFVLPTDGVEAVFQLLPGDPVRILLEKARAGFVGGTLATSDALIDPSAAAQDLVIKLADIDLEKLLGLLALEGLSGTGVISGDVPVSVLDTGAVIIRNSELRALGPGLIQLKSETVANALKGGGESVNLMLRALEDFHYKSLVLSADKAEDGEATILLSLSGQNPAVLEGQPFDFNIRLGTNLDTISEAIRQGLAISGNIFGNLR